MSDTSTPLMLSLPSGQQMPDLLLRHNSSGIQLSGKSVFLSLSSLSLSVSKEKRPDESFGEYLLANIVGASCKSKKYYNETHFSMEVYVYEVYKKCCSSVKDGNFRRRKVVVFKFDKNESLCRKWTNAINSAIVGCIPLLVAENGVDILPPPKQRHFLVFVNPVGGKGVGIKIWNKEVKPILEEADIRIQLCITQYANHAKTMLLDLDLSSFDGIAIVGGDGLIFEVINGITSRPDSAHILNTVPIIPIPGGTGNGLVKSMLFECGEAYGPLNATFVAVKGVPVPFDLSRVVTASGTVHHAFLIMGWGLVSDIDILSETMRFMGELRLFIAAVYFILAKRKYKGRLRMQLANADNENEQQQPQQPLPQTYQNPVSSSSNDNLSNSRASSGTTPSAYPYAATNDIESGGNSTSRESLDSSTRWVTLEGDFVLVWVMQASHATASMHTGPGCKLNDGIFTIYVIREMSRCEMLQMLIAADSGQHVHMPKIQIYKAVAYTLEPLTEKGIYTLDGEVVEYGLLQATVMPAAAKCMSLLKV